MKERVEEFFSGWGMNRGWAGTIEGEPRLLTPRVHEVSVVVLGGIAIAFNAIFEPTDELLIL
jgi:uncharacterized membrane protein